MAVTRSMSSNQAVPTTPKKPQPPKLTPPRKPQILKLSQPRKPVRLILKGPKPIKQEPISAEELRLQNIALFSGEPSSATESISPTHRNPQPAPPPAKIKAEPSRPVRVENSYKDEGYHRVLGGRVRKMTEKARLSAVGGVTPNWGHFRIVKW